METIQGASIDILNALGINSSERFGRIIMLAFIIIITFAVDFLCKNIVLKLVAKFVRKTKATWDDILFDSKVMTRFSHLIAPIIVIMLLPIAIPKEDSILYIITYRICQIVITIFSLSFFSALLTACYSLYSTQEQFKNRPLKGLLQTAKVILFLIGTIIVISLIIDKSPAALLTTLGASAAILMLVFKDSILGVVSGIQLSANDMLKVGDWIAIPKHNADGTVIEVTLNTVKVRNWDNTIITIPPYLLTSDSFQNWRGMEESSGRRVKRSINIDMTSVKFCTKEMLEKYSKIQFLKEYISNTEQELKSYNETNGIDNTVMVNGKRQTNLGVFRAYLTYYLLNNPNINHSLTCMVRQLQPTETGIPIELYFFSAIKEWKPYESIQADVFDHLLAVVKEFDLRVFQNPSGEDFRRLV